MGRWKKTMAEPGQVVLDFASDLEPYLRPSIARLGYLYPRLVFNTRGSAIVVTNLEALKLDIAEISEAVRYTVYRQKIDAEAAPLRHAMYRALFG